MAQTKSSAEVWLLGKGTDQLSGPGGSHLPTNGDALRLLMFLHTEQKLTLNEAASRSVSCVIQLWQRARIPHQRIDSGVCILHDSMTTMRSSKRTGREAMNRTKRTRRNSLVITGSKETVDRIAVPVTGDGEERLLRVTKISRGTGKHQAEACLTILDEWGIQQQICGLVFDTTASNTRLKNGACTFIEHSLDHEMTWVACRHHVMDLVLAGIFRALFEPTPTGGPDVALFKYSKGFRLAGHTLTSLHMRLLLMTCLIHVLLSFELRW